MPWASPQVVITGYTPATTLHVEVETNDWPRRYHDLETSLYQVKAELSSVLERERSLISRNLELERRQSANTALEEQLQQARKELGRKNCSEEEIQRRLEAALKNSTSKEKLCEQLRSQLRLKDQELEKSKDELQKLRVEFNKDQELHHRSMTDLREVLERQVDRIKEDLRLKDQDLQLVRTDLQREEQLHHSAVAEICDLRQRLKVTAEQDAKHLRMVDLLQSERDLWLRRSSECKPTEVVDIHITSPPTPPLYPSRRYFYRRLT